MDPDQQIPPEIMQMLTALSAQQQQQGSGMGGQNTSFGNSGMPDVSPTVVPQLPNNTGMPPQSAAMVNSLMGGSPTPDLTQAPGMFGGSSVSQGMPSTANRQQGNAP